MSGRRPLPAWSRVVAVALALFVAIAISGHFGEGEEPAAGTDVNATATDLATGLGAEAPSADATSPEPADPTPAPTASTFEPAAAPSEASTAGASPAPSAPNHARSGLLQVASVADGDTLTMRVDGARERVRIIGIDTPEIGQCGADAARSALVAAVSDGVRLAGDPTQADRDRFGRLLRHVQLPDGRQAAQVLIRAGHGREYTYDRAYRHRESYVSAQRAARSEQRGVWGSACSGARPFAQPAPARTQAPPAAAPRATGGAPARGGSASDSSTGECTIKGNISSKGEKIYHVPGGRSYDATVITRSKGERWFCSESDARAAGWRAARG